MDDGRLKTFFRKLFLLDTPAAGTFWSLCLMLCGCGICATLYWFTDGIVAYNLYNLRSRYTQAYIPWQLIFPALGISFILHFIFQYFRLFLKLSISRFAIIASLLCAVAVFSKALGLWWCGLIVFILLYGFGALFFDRSAWKSIVLHGILFSALAYCVYCILYCLDRANWDCNGILLMQQYAAVWFQVLSWAFILLLVGTVIAAGKMYSALCKSCFKAIFTWRVKILFALTVLFHIALIVAGMIAGNVADKEYENLSANQKTPLTVEALKEKYLRTNADTGFWEKINKLSEQKKGEPIEPYYHTAGFPEDKVKAWQKFFSASENHAEIDRMISRPLPGHERNIKKGSLAAVPLPDYQRLRAMACWQFWRIRAALKKGDKAAILAALQRLDNLSAYFAHEPYYIGMMVKLHIDEIKIQALELILGAKLLNEAELIELKNSCRRVRDILPEIEYEALWSEMMLTADTFYAFINGWEFDGKQIAGLKMFRFILPQLPLTLEINRFNALKMYRNVSKFSDIPQRPHLASGSVYRYYADTYTRVSHSIVHHLKRAVLQQQCMEFFLEQELYFLKYGKYQENPVLPLDPFSGKPMTLVTGELTVTVPHFDGYGKVKQVRRRGRRLVSTKIPIIKKPLEVTVFEPRK
ncbi:MAG: hypothetical protein E7054_00770 [Lentisphaerae bacterium]|nr:hypothetical protein [Lentisphaerota bacterium]